MGVRPRLSSPNPPVPSILPTTITSRSSPIPSMQSAGGPLPSPTPLRMSNSHFPLHWDSNPTSVAPTTGWPSCRAADQRRMHLSVGNPWAPFSVRPQFYFIVYSSLKFRQHVSSYRQCSKPWRFFHRSLLSQRQPHIIARGSSAAVRFGGQHIRRRILYVHRFIFALLMVWKFL